MYNVYRKGLIELFYRHGADPGLIRYDQNLMSSAHTTNDYMVCKAMTQLFNAFRTDYLRFDLLVLCSILFQTLQVSQKMFSDLNQS